MGAAIRSNMRSEWTSDGRTTHRARSEQRRVEIQYLGSEAAGYRAGACNIGPAEIARRRRAGLFAVAVAVVLAVVLLAIDAPNVARALVLLPLAGGIVSLEQARRRFCVGFAMAGLQNFEALGRQQHIADGVARAADRRAALVMVVQGTLVAAVLTALFVILPV